MKIKRSKLKELAIQFIGNDSLEAQNQIAIKIATARCARLSYMTFDGEIDYIKDIQLHDRLLADKHMSPFEHCARAMSDFEYNDAFDKQENGKLSLGWCNNFRGWIQYRYLVENK